MSYLLYWGASLSSQRIIIIITVTAWFIWPIEIFQTLRQRFLPGFTVTCDAVGLLSVTSIGTVHRRLAPKPALHIAHVSSEYVS